MGTNPTLHLLGFEITKVLFERPLECKTGDFDIQMNNLSDHEAGALNFKTTIFITINSAEHPSFNLHVEGVGVFKMEGDLQSNPIVVKNFVAISAPSIVYPFLRAFISNMLVQTGMNPIILPTVNFGAIAAVDKKEQQ